MSSFGRKLRKATTGHKQRGFIPETIAIDLGSRAIAQAFTHPGEQVVRVARPFKRPIAPAPSNFSTEVQRILHNDQERSSLLEELSRIAESGEMPALAEGETILDVVKRRMALRKVVIDQSIGLVTELALPGPGQKP